LAPPLPIDAYLALITDTLIGRGTLLLQATPGAGKTTRVPLALLESLPEPTRILLIQPRRLAARSAAQRLAEALNETPGGRVGYSVRFDHRSSKATRLEVMTTGVFLRRLQGDPELMGVGAVVFDEFHERGAEADLALALLRHAREELRPDLLVLLMSATLDLEPLAAGMAGAAVITVPGRSHPVDVRYQVPRERESLSRQVLRGLEEHWLGQRHEGETVLVFLPGQREIGSCLRAIAETPWGQTLECVPLHGHLSLEGQLQAIAPAPSKAGKIVLATSIAESSLTLAGVRLVVDSGLSRVNRYDPARGMDQLVTQPCSQASATQRCGRAGRLGPGRCLRLWSPAEQARRPAFDPPELLQADPLPLALQLAAWGSGDGTELPWLQPPPPQPLEQARRLLTQMGALNDQGRITAHGKAMAGIGLPPRLSHMLLLAAERGWLEQGCAVAALLSERDPLDVREVGADLLHRLDWLRRGGRSGPWREVMLQLKKQVAQAATTHRRSADPGPHQSEDLIAGQLLCWAYPERIALGRGKGDGAVLMRHGGGARLAPGDPLCGAAALAIARVEGHQQEARVLLAVAIPAAQIESLAGESANLSLRTRWDGSCGRVRCERVRRLDSLELEVTPWPEADPTAIAHTLLEAVRNLGLECLPWTPRCRQLQQRLTLAHKHLGQPWPDCCDKVLLATLPDWLGPQAEGRRSLQELQEIDLEAALWGGLDWQQRSALEALLPTSFDVPSGRRVPLIYGIEEVVLPVRLQEMFGCDSTPPLLDGTLPLTVHLLSPAGRPAAITRDLAGFWRSGYAQTRRELRGRYPRHAWPEDPTQAQATPRPPPRQPKQQKPNGGR
jgi:ATP-dependent helicase HrpB